jgi:hypothetical protein
MEIQITCDIPAYTDVINLCFMASSSAAIIAAYIRSICLHHFGGYNPESNNVDISEIHKSAKSSIPNIKMEALQSISMLKEKNDNIMKIIAHALDDSDGRIVNQAIAAITTISPQQIQAKLALLLDQ